MTKELPYSATESVKFNGGIPAVVGVYDIITHPLRDKMCGDYTSAGIFYYQLITLFCYKYSRLVVAICAERKRVTVTPVLYGICFNNLMTINSCSGEKWHPAP